MSESTYLSGKVRKRTLPAFPGPPGPGAPLLKRMLLPQGELAQVHDGEEAMHYIAFIALQQGTARGNHFHKVKEEFLYLLRGALILLLEDVQTKARESVPLQAGDLVVIPPGVAHTLRVTESGDAVEFSPARFDAGDIYRYSLG